MNFRWVVGIAAACAMFTGAASAADQNSRVAAKTDWSIFVEGNPVQCWVVSAPKATVNTKDGHTVSVTRGDIYMFVSFWPDKKQLGEVSFLGGYPFAEGSTVTLAVGDSKFELFTKDETAWAASPEDDQKISAAMKRGSEATLTGHSARGTVTKDTFSLKGFSAAMEDAQTRCVKS